VSDECALRASGAAEAGVDAAWGAGLVDAIITASRAQIV
jgi:hypothetical protein